MIEDFDNPVSRIMLLADRVMNIINGYPDVSCDFMRTMDRIAVISYHVNVNGNVHTIWFDTNSVQVRTNPKISGSYHSPILYSNPNMIDIMLIQLGIMNE